jgi:thymidine kinase
MEAMDNQLVVYTGPMWGGKTSRMLLEVEKHRHGGREIHAFKPKIDNRYASEEIVTHMGWSIPATCVKNGADIERHMLEHAKEFKNSLIVVDELFMLPGVADTLVWFFKQGVDVVVATLDLSYSCKPFEEVTKLLPWATRVEKCPSACLVCGHDAYYTYRKVDIASEEEVQVGGKETYEPRCRKHHPAMEE